MLTLSKTLAFKAQGDDQLMAGPIALKFEARGSRVLDAQISIVRVAAAGAQAPASTVVAGPASHMVKSGKCTYFYAIHSEAPSPSPSPAAAAANIADDEHAQPRHSDQDTPDENQGYKSGTEADNDSSGDNAKGAAEDDHSSASSSEAWPSDNEDDVTDPKPAPSS
ncbi:hypothetical protein GGI00_002920 [Coemansia sp. RSA 2681]|nr:hypothetical protein GGI00_002920 [Coemansia sp. RSA 2681]